LTAGVRPRYSLNILENNGLTALPRTVRDARLETATQRSRIALGRFAWVGVAEGLALGYRRTKAGYGAWYVRTLIDRLAGRYDLKRIARADDHEPADGSETLTYLQARDRAHLHARDAGRGAPRPTRLEIALPYTVKRAVDDYLEWFAAHRKSLAGTRTVLNAHVLPKLGARLVADLRKDELARWHARLATTPARLRTAKGVRSQAYREQDLADPTTLRRRRATANRILATFRAVLNHAWREGHVASDAAWRPLRPFRGVDEPRVHYLEHDEARRLVNACEPELRALVRAGLLTGCRYGELIAMRVADFRADSGTVFIATSKSGKSRHVPLTDEGLRVFDELTSGRPSAELLFTRAGQPWGKNHQVRALTEACAKAKISPPVSFHILRHSYGSWLAQRGVPLQVIAEALGHADTRITQRHYGHLAPSYVAQVIRENLPEISSTVSKVQALRAPMARREFAQRRNARRM